MNRTPAPPSPFPELRRRLEERKARLYQEIEGYPTPIPGCDQHFNWLLEQREKIAGELRRLDGATPPAPEEAEAMLVVLAEGPRAG